MNNHEIKSSTCKAPFVTAARRSHSAYVYADSFFRPYRRRPPHPQLNMSTNPETTEARPMTTRTTEITARRGTDPWAATNEEAATPSARAQRQFEPTHYERLRNLVDKRNAYCER